MCSGVSKTMKREEVYSRTLRFSGAGTYDLMEQAEVIAKQKGITLNMLQRIALTEYLTKNTTIQSESVGCGFLNSKNEVCSGEVVGSGHHVGSRTETLLCRKHYFDAQKTPYLWRNILWLNHAILKCATDNCPHEPTFKVRSLQTNKILVFCDKCTEPRWNHEKWEIIYTIKETNLQ